MQDSLKSTIFVLKLEEKRSLSNHMFRFIIRNELTSHPQLSFLCVLQYCTLTEYFVSLLSVFQIFQIFWHSWRLHKNLRILRFQFFFSVFLSEIMQTFDSDRRYKPEQSKINRLLTNDLNKKAESYISAVRVKPLQSVIKAKVQRIQV